MNTTHQFLGCRHARLCFPRLRHFDQRRTRCFFVDPVPRVLPFRRPGAGAGRRGLGRKARGGGHAALVNLVHATVFRHTNYRPGCGQRRSMARLPHDERPRRRWEHQRRRAESRGAHQRQLKRGDQASGGSAAKKRNPPGEHADAANPPPLRRTREAHGGRRADAQRWSTCAPAQQRTARPTTRRGEHVGEDARPPR